jgi:hypothetical protein
LKNLAKHTVALCVDIVGIDAKENRQVDTLQTISTIADALNATVFHPIHQQLSRIVRPMRF